MAVKLPLKHALTAMCSSMRESTKLLLMLGVMAALVGSLDWEEDTCGAERVVALAESPLEMFEKKSVAEVEKNEMSTITIEGEETTRPSGFVNGRWEKLKRQYQKGGCIFHYRVDCGVLCGSEGYLLIRNGEVIYSFHTKIS